MSDDYESCTGRSKFFTIHRNDVGTEAYQDHYVHDLQAGIERLTELNTRALAIIADAIMHGMPITGEVAAVRNAIVCDKPLKAGGE